MKFAKDKIYKNKNKHMSNKELKDKFKKYEKNTYIYIIRIFYYSYCRNVDSYKFKVQGDNQR